MNTVTDAPPRDASAPLLNFDAHQSYTWIVFRPGTTAGFNRTSGVNDPALYTNFTTQNTTAQITITDAVTNTTFSRANGNLTAAVLNQYLAFDPSAGTPVGALGFVDPNTGAAVAPGSHTAASKRS